MIFVINNNFTYSYSRFKQRHINSHFPTTTILLITTLIVITFIYDTNAKSIDNDPIQSTPENFKITDPNVPRSEYNENNNPNVQQSTHSELNTSTTFVYDNFQFASATISNTSSKETLESMVLPKILKISTIPAEYADTDSRHAGHIFADNYRETVSERRKGTKLRSALDQAASQGLQEMMEMFEVKEPELMRKGINRTLKFSIATLNICLNLLISHQSP